MNAESVAEINGSFYLHEAEANQGGRTSKILLFKEPSDSGAWNNDEDVFG